MTPSVAAATPAVGYRVWFADVSDTWNRYRLQSLLAETLWPFHEQLEAVCDRRLAGRAHWRLRQLGVPRHRAPAADCSCGAHAYHDLRAMVLQVQRLGHFRRFSDRRLLVGGAILSWGRLVIHPEGFRAQYARPLALALVDPTAGPDAEEHLQAIARAYAVPALDLKYLGPHASEFGVSYKPERPVRTLAVRTRSAVDWLQRWWSQSRQR
jgi:hypothetical protein